MDDSNILFTVAIYTVSFFGIFFSAGSVLIQFQKDKSEAGGDLQRVQRARRLLNLALGGNLAVLVSLTVGLFKEFHDFRETSKREVADSLNTIRQSMVDSSRYLALSRLGETTLGQAATILVQIDSVMTQQHGTFNQLVGSKTTPRIELLIDPAGPGNYKLSLNIENRAEVPLHEVSVKYETIDLNKVSEEIQNMKEEQSLDQIIKPFVGQDGPFEIQGRMRRLVFGKYLEFERNYELRLIVRWSSGEYAADISLSPHPSKPSLAIYDSIPRKLFFNFSDRDTLEALCFLKTPNKRWYLDMSTYNNYIILKNRHKFVVQALRM